MNDSFENGINGLIDIVAVYDNIEFALYGHSIWEGRMSDNIYKVLEGLLIPYLSEYYPIILTDNEGFVGLCDYVLNCCNFHLDEFNSICEATVRDIEND